jgi:signal transduction histidine kinase
MPTPEEIAEENERLSAQVRRLIRAESRLYTFQEELERQRSLLKKVAQTGARLNAGLNRQHVLRATLECIVVDLAYERCVALEEQSGHLQVLDNEGYYDGTTAAALHGRSLPLGPRLFAGLQGSHEPLLHPLPGNPDAALAAELQALAAQLFLDRCLIFALADAGESREQRAHGPVLVVGGTAARARFHTPVTRESPVLALVTLLLSQSIAALRNADLYAELLHERDSLERKVISRTAELSRTNTELSMALDKARESERLKREFLANVSHELRTPLNSIINIPDGLLESFPSVAAVRCSACGGEFLLDEGETLDPKLPCASCQATASLQAVSVVLYQGQPSETRQFLQSVVSCGRHLLQIVNDILDTSRLEAGRVELHLRPVALPTVLSDVQQAVAALAAERDVVLDLPGAADPTIPDLIADPLRLTQILINLLGNAIKFSHAGGRVCLRIDYQPEVVRFAVRDEGIGIAPEHHKHIFESFRQIEGGHTRRYGGSGLGLAIVRQLTELHHGRVWVQSSLGQGSTFFVQLPRGLR